MAGKQEKLSIEQQDLLLFIKDYIGETGGVAPTIAEMADGLSQYNNAIVDKLRILERKGYIKRMPGTARGLVIIKGKQK